MSDVSQGASPTLDSSDELEQVTGRGTANSDDLSSRNTSPPSQELRYTGVDRRTPSIKSFIYGAFNPRRRRIRRAQDRNHTYLDWHPTHLLLTTAAVLVLSVIDGLMTVYLVENRVAEFGAWIPYMGGVGPNLFALGKILVTAVVAVALVLTAHMRIFRVVKASTILYVFLSSYSVLLLWQLSLVLKIS